MKWLSELRRRLGFRGEAFDADLSEEMRLHLELRAEQGREKGLEDADARAAAQRRFGNTLHLHEASREAWGWSFLEKLWQDVRYGMRALAANPGFTATAVLSLALGIGANTAIFSLINAVMLRSLPVEDPKRLVQIRSEDNTVFTNPLWEQIRDHQKIFSGVLAYGGDRFDLTTGGESRFADGLWVSGDFFRVLGVPALRGRMLSPDDDKHGCGAAGLVAVVSHDFWQGNYNADPAVVGKTVTLNRHKFEIVGVTPPWFKGLSLDRGYDVAIPIGCEPVLHTDQSALKHRSWWWLQILGRLGPETTAEQAEAHLSAIGPDIYKATLPGDWERQDQESYLRRPLGVKAAPSFSGTGDRYRKALLTLMAIVGLVLIVACVNVANLLLARASARHHEIAVRMAIGAKRGRVVRQLLTESLLLSVLGAAGGLLLAIWGSGTLVRMLSTSREQLEVNLTPDLRVLAFTAGVAMLTALLFGLVPALRVTRLGENSVMKEGARGATGGAGRLTLTRGLLAGQVALSLLLLAGAGLFLTTLRNLLTLDAGFARRDVLIVEATVEEKAVPKPRRNQLFQEILEKIRSVPGVMSASSAALTPVSNIQWNQHASPEGFTPATREESLVYMNRVSPDYFRTMGTRLLMGRDFNDRDSAGAPPVIIVSESAARKFFGTGNPVGKRIGLETAPSKWQQHQVVGVVQDIRYARLDETPLLTAYLAAAQEPDPWTTTYFEVRKAGGVEALIPVLRSAISSVNPGVSMTFRTFEMQIAESLLQQRLIAYLSAMFAALALILAMVGLYGTAAYSVTRRQGEIGIRVALGAQRRSVVWLVLRDFVVLITVGLVAGLLLSSALTRIIASLLYGVRPMEVGPLMIAAAILVVCTMVAAWVPARRAAGLDPMIALRQE
jgi:predicted permease